MKKALLVVTVTLFTVLSAVAQAASQPEEQPTKNCQAELDANDQQSKQKPQAESDELSKKLGNCGGVLKPPPTGDENATTPPPTGSDMPVIKPGEVPPQTGQ